MNNKNYLDFDNMYKALKKSCRNVRWKTSVTQFEMNGLKNTAKALRDLRRGTYRLSSYQHFTIYEPKKREITATRIRDRQIQRCICDTVLYEELTKSFIYQNGACQQGKGTRFVLQNFKKQLVRFRRTHKNGGYYLKCDIRHFFENIDHSVLKEKLQKRLKDRFILKLVCDVIDSFGDRGLGLGSQISQLLALFYLDELDHIIKEKLKIKCYTRYMDDFVLVAETKEELLEAKKVIEEYLGEVNLELNQKTVLQPIRYGIMYLHWQYKFNSSGRLLMLPDKLRCTKRRAKLKRLLTKVKENTTPLETFEDIVRSMRVHLEQGNAYKAIQQIECLRGQVVCA